MKRVRWLTTDGTPVEGDVRMGWLRVMYIVNIAANVPLALGVLIAPAAMADVMGVQPPELVHFGIGAGAVPGAFVILGALGLRAPLRFVPVLGFQIVYKLIYMIGVFLPLVLTGDAPSFSYGIAALFALFVIGDLIAIPRRYFFATGSR